MEKNRKKISLNTRILSLIMIVSLLMVNVSMISPAFAEDQGTGPVEESGGLGVLDLGDLDTGDEGASPTDEGNDTTPPAGEGVSEKNNHINCQLAHDGCAVDADLYGKTSDTAVGQYNGNRTINLTVGESVTFGACSKGTQIALQDNNSDLIELSGFSRYYDALKVAEHASVTAKALKAGTVDVVFTGSQGYELIIVTLNIVSAEAETVTFYSDNQGQSKDTSFELPLDETATLTLPTQEHLDANYPNFTPEGMELKEWSLTPAGNANMLIPGASHTFESRNNNKVYAVWQEKAVEPTAPEYVTEGQKANFFLLKFEMDVPSNGLGQSSANYTGLGSGTVKSTVYDQRLDAGMPFLPGNTTTHKYWDSGSSALMDIANVGIGTAIPHTYMVDGVSYASAVQGGVKSGTYWYSYRDVDVEGTYGETDIANGGVEGLIATFPSFTLTTEILAAAGYVGFDPDEVAVRFYTVKNEGTIHVDGYLVELPEGDPVTGYSVTYLNDGNNHGKPTDGNDYATGTEVTVWGNGTSTVDNVTDKNMSAYVQNNFLGWQVVSGNIDNSLLDTNGYLQPDAKFNITSNVTLQAVWSSVSNKYSITYVGNGGLDTNGMDTFATEHSYSDAVPNAEANRFVREHYTFAGWNTVQNPTADTPGVPYAVGAQLSKAPMTLYAQWTADEYTITYHSNNGANGTDVNNHTYIEAAVDAKANMFTYTNHTFKGWATSANGTVAYAPGVTLPKGNLDLYAVWDENQYTITYKANYTGATPATATDLVSYVDQVPDVREGNTFNRTNYTFAGWNTIADGSGSSYTAGNSFGTHPGNITLYAQWAEKTYTITYKANYVGATAADEVRTYSYASNTFPTILAGNTFNRANYTFAGWNTVANGTGTSYTASEALVAHLAGNLELFAQWSANPYAITYEVGYNAVPAIANVVDNGTMDPDEADPKVIEKPTTFVREGYKFVGWEDANGKEYVIDTTLPRANLTLIAQWEVIPYTITYIANYTDANPIKIAYNGTMDPLEAKMTVEDYTLFIRNGYTLVGWTANSDGSGTSFRPGDELEKATRTLYAQWVENYTVTYEANVPAGATGLTGMPNPASSEKADGTVFNAHSALGLNEYTFSHWVIKSGTVTNGKGGVVDANNITVGSELKVSASDVVFEAVWTKNDVPSDDVVDLGDFADFKTYDKLALTAESQENEILTAALANTDFTSLLARYNEAAQESNLNVVFTARENSTTSVLNVVDGKIVVDFVVTAGTSGTFAKGTVTLHINPIDVGIVINDDSKTWGTTDIQGYAGYTISGVLANESAQENVDIFRMPFDQTLQIPEEIVGDYIDVLNAEVSIGNDNYRLYSVTPGDFEITQQTVVPPVGDTYYNLTVNYVDIEGTALAASDSTRLIEDSNYSANQRTFDGYTFLRSEGDATSGVMNGDKEVTFVYSADTVIEESDPPLNPTPAVTETPPATTTPPVQITDAPPPLVALPSDTPAPTDPADPTDPVEIPEPSTPLAGGEETPEVIITEPETPLAAGDGAAWALVNLILTVFTGILSVVLLIGYFRNKREDEEYEDEDVKRKGGMRLFSIAPAIAAIVVFILTEDMSLPMTMVDKWTILMAIIALVQCAVTYMSRKVRDEESENA